LTQGKIKYKEALAAISINTDTDNPLEKNWIVRIPNVPNEEQSPIESYKSLEE
jgi:hypothetical protein